MADRRDGHNERTTATVSRKRRGLDQKKYDGDDNGRGIPSGTRNFPSIDHQRLPVTVVFTIYKTNRVNIRCWRNGIRNVRETMPFENVLR